MAEDARRFCSAGLAVEDCVNFDQKYQEKQREESPVSVYALTFHSDVVMGHTTNARTVTPRKQPDKLIFTIDVLRSNIFICLIHSL